MHRVRFFALVGVVGAVWALVFAAISTLDYASHLDRGLHDLHCSFIPGAEASEAGEGCRVALNSPYSAVLKQRYWGGIPISLFGLGCFAFLIGHSSFMTFWGGRASRNAAILYFLLAISPLFVSAGMFAISWFQLGSICKTCAGIYIGSVILAVSGFGVLIGSWHTRRGFSLGSFAGAVGALAGIATWTLAPSVVYAALVPDHGPFVGQCGTIKQPKEPHGALLELKGSRATHSAIFFEDPLCPTCKSLHDRLDHAGALEKLSIEMALFPLDNECNWMLDQPLHPGACQVARAVLCAKSPQQLMNWAYANQDALIETGKAGKPEIVKMLESQWGKGLGSCMQSKDTTQRLNRHLHFAVDNAIAVSTPQVFIDGRRLCDEDIDIGLMFALEKLAPRLLE
jgi:uncharacterized membrane protein